MCSENVLFDFAYIYETKEQKLNITKPIRMIDLTKLCYSTMNLSFRTCV